MSGENVVRSPAPVDQVVDEMDRLIEVLATIPLDSPVDRHCLTKSITSAQRMRRWFKLATDDVPRNEVKS